MNIISLTMTINASVMTTPDTPATKRNPGKEYNHDKLKQTLTFHGIFFRAMDADKNKSIQFLIKLDKVFC